MLSVYFDGHESDTSLVSILSVKELLLILSTIKRFLTCIHFSKDISMYLSETHRKPICFLLVSLLVRIAQAKTAFMNHKKLLCSKNVCMHAKKRLISARVERESLLIRDMGDKQGRKKIS